MSPELFAVYVPQDAYVDRIDALLSEEFSASISSITQGNIYHYLDLERTGDVVRHIQSGKKNSDGFGCITSRSLRLCTSR